ncbi:hypothetical protein [Micromonospora sp. DT233]|uniref:hypothetical protein n=1 Tax=Micromonospora sp. DT233 TaxID=3393432 RepID=UPI003CF7B9CA
MPVPVVVTDRRGPRLLSVLFWTGVAFAPVAALILLVADGNGPLRVAAVLAIVAVVLIGLSIALRAGADGGGADPAETERLRDEIEELRRDLRDEIVAAARRGNQALDASQRIQDQSQRIQDQVSALRRRLDAAAAGIAADPEPPAVEPAATARAAVQPPAAQRVGAGRAQVPVTEAYDDAGHRWDTDEAGLPRDTVDDVSPGRARVRAVVPEDEEQPARRSRAAARAGADASVDAYPVDAYPVDGYPVDGYPVDGYPATLAPAESGSRSSRPFPPDPLARPVGTVRHTETVHVTTRHTVVDGPDPVADPYGGPAGRWSAAPEAPPWATPRAEAPPAEAPWPAPRAEAPWTGRHAGRAGQHDDARWPEPPDAAERPGRGYDPIRPGRRDGHSWTDDPRRADPAGDSRRGEPGDSRWGEPADDPRWGGPAEDPRRVADDRGPADRADAGRRMRREGGPGAGPAGDDEPRPVDPRSWYAPAEAGWPAGAGPVRAYPPEPPPAGTGQWSELRACDRWAEVHDDERGREVRIGERRAAAHADDAGGGYRVEGRWAALRDAPAGGAWTEPGPPPGEAAVPSQWRPQARRDARPAGSWQASVPEPERPSRHQRPDEDRHVHDDAPSSGGTWDRWR